MIQIISSCMTSISLFRQARRSLLSEKPGQGKVLCKPAAQIYEPTKGRITLDKKNLKDFRQQDLRRQIGIVQQDDLG